MIKTTKKEEEIKINYTYYKKLNEILNNKNIDKDEINKEKNNILSNITNSMWGLTDAQKTYINILNNILNIKKLKKLKLKKLKKVIEKSFDKKIRVVFFTYEHQTFPTFKPIYDLMKQDKMFVCDLVHIPFLHPNKEYNDIAEIEDYKQNGYNEIVRSEDYDLCSSCPDVAIWQKGYDLVPANFFIDEIEKVINKSIYIPYGMEVGTSETSIKYETSLPIHDKAWKCISYCKELYNRACKFSLQKGKNFLFLGHPRFDLSKLDLTEDKEYKKIKRLAKNRKIILYNAHFAINDVSGGGTFSEYGFKILDYFSKRKDLFLIFRPHPLFYGSLKNIYGDDQKFWKKYNNYINNYENIILDINANYLISMHVSDILLSDRSSLVPEFLIYNKPVIYLFKKKTLGFQNKELENMLYICYDEKDIIKYINNLINGNDILVEHRKKDIKNVFNYDDEISVSQKIINLIIEYFKEN